MEGRIFTESEKSDICMMYRQAKYPDVQIEILADLYDCAKKDIMRVLNASSRNQKKNSKDENENPQIEIIQKVIGNELSVAQGANICGVTEYTFREWVKKYKKFGVVKIRPKRSGYQCKYYQEHREKMLAAANKRNREKRDTNGKSV